MVCVVCGVCGGWGGDGGRAREVGIRRACGVWDGWLSPFDNARISKAPGPVIISLPYQAKWSKIFTMVLVYDAWNYQA